MPAIPPRGPHPLPAGSPLGGSSVRALGALALLGIAACDPVPKPGTQIGALREPDPSPAPPSDLRALDMESAVTEALRIGGLTTLASAWPGHVTTLERAPYDCPGIRLGPLPEGVANVDMGDEDGMSWLADCTTEQGAPDALTFSGFAHWTNTLVADTSGNRSLIAEARVTDANGAALFEFDGEASDSLELGTGTYTSTLDGELSGSLTGADLGLRTGGAFEATWSADGTLRLFGTVTALEGFGPADARTVVDSPEIAGLPQWAPGMPRFTSIRFDLEYTPECTAEPVGYVGLRGNEGFWLDVYFLPKYAPDEVTFEADAFPYEQIDNIACDGIGTLFARNIDLKAMDEEDPSWSREIAPDLASSITAMPTPTLEDFIYTLRDIPEPVE